MKNKLLKIFSLLTEKQRKRFWVIMLFIFIGMGLEMLGVGIIVPVLGAILDADNPDNELLQRLISITGAEKETEIVIYVLLVLVVIAFVKIIYFVGLTYFKYRYTAHITRDLAKDLYRGYLYNPYPFHLKVNSSQLLRNVQIETNEFNNALHAMMNMTTEITVIMGMIGVLFYYEPVGAFSTGSVLVLAAILFQKAIKKSLIKWGKKRQSLDGDINKVLLQSLNGIKDVKLSGKETFFHEIYSDRINRKIDFLTKHVTVKNMPKLYFEFLAMIGLVLLVYIMIQREVMPESILSTIAIFAATAFKMIPSFNVVMASLQQIRFTEPSVNILYEDVKATREASPELHEDTGVDLPFEKEIAIRNAYFKFEEATENIFNGLDLDIQKGKVIGFIGKSGSGKSTLADIIMGLHSLGDGQILCDSKDVTQNMRRWQSRIGYVPQSIYLIDDTITANIAFGINKEEIDEQRLLEAVNGAQLNEFVSLMDDGLNSIVGEAGTRLSGGQRQRIGIARALYRNPQILIFDEATSALDNNTEKAVMDAIYAIKNKTILIIAHRLSTLAKCDYIYRFEEGEIVDQGKPETLLANY